jgi:hypothetical protein
MSRYVSMFHLTLLVLISAFPAYSAPPLQPLLKGNEKTIFSFQVANSAKIATIAVSTVKPEYIVYRFGTAAKVELKFPQDKVNSWQQFTYSFYFRGGGAANEGLDMNYLSFTNGNFKYTVYQEYVAVGNQEYVGIRILDTKTNKKYEVSGDSGNTVGSLLTLRDDARVTKE